MIQVTKDMLKVILNGLKPWAEEIIAEEQAGFWKGRSTIKQILNLYTVYEKHQQHQREFYHVFVDFKKVFDSKWQEALWATMKKFNISQKLIYTIQQLYTKATSAVLAKDTIGKWFHVSVGLNQGCLPSPTLFKIILEQIKSIAQDYTTSPVSMGGRTITNLHFADDIDGLAGKEEKEARQISEPS